MQVKVLFDKEARDKKLHTGWGVSFLVNGEILFDTGEKGSWLLGNMEKLGVEISKIRSVIVSHQHWDHTGGLWDLLEKRRGVRVYVCPDFSREFKKKIKDLGADIVENKGFFCVDKDIFVTGQIRGSYKGAYIAEQALVLKAKNGLTVMTGCSHPGVDKVLEVVKEKFSHDKLYFVFGGFHLMDKDRREIKIVVERLKELGVEKVGPTHCTGYEAQQIFKDAYGDSFIFIKAGMEFDV